MKWSRFFLVLLVLTLLDSGQWMQQLALGTQQIRPDLLLIALVFFVGNCTPSEAMYASFVIGLAADISSEGWVIGPCVLSFGVIGTLLSQVRKVVGLQRVLFQFVTIFAAALLILPAMYVLIGAKTGQSVSHPVSAICGGALYTAAVGPILWKLLSFLGGWLGFHQPPPYTMRRYV
jgi:rod shape-determining protein MreD